MITKSILIIMTEEPINILESIKQGLQDIVVPEMREIKSDIRRLDDKIESARNELKAEIHRLDDKMGSGFARLDDKIDNLGKRIDSMDRRLDEAFSVRQRLAALEARMASR